MYINQSDLDMTTSAGQRTLDRRIKQAISKMCVVDALSRPLGECEWRYGRVSGPMLRPLNLLEH